jgi:hypothetical protein
MADPEARIADANREFVSSSLGGGKLDSTGPTGTKDKRGGNKWIWDTVPEAGQRIVQLDDELKQLANTMDSRIKRMLAEHEKDFFLAYKTHMYAVQKDFKELKAKADEEDSKTRKDQKIQRLEKQLDWFMTEAMRLDDLCKRYKKEVDKWKAKGEALEEDHRFLEDQIKGAKRQNKVLRAAVERAQTSAYSVLVISKEREKGGTPDLALPGRPASTEPYGTQTGDNVARSASAPRKLGGTAPAGALPVSVVSGNEVEQRYLDTIRELKQTIEAERKTLNMLRATRANAYTHKSEMEDFFLACVDEARRDMNKRKFIPQAVRSGDLPPEKQKILETLLGSEEVLVLLYEKLFPHRRGLAQQQVESGAGGSEQ